MTGSTQHRPAPTGRLRTSQLRDPAVLTALAVGFLVSALGQAVLRQLLGAASTTVTAFTIAFSAAGSVLLTAAIVTATRSRSPR